METAKRTLESRRGDGEVMVVEETTPERLRLDWRRPKGFTVKVPADRHPTQTEVIRVLEGRLTATVAGNTRRLGPGEEVEVPAGVIHRMVNDPAQPFHAEITFMPATAMLEFFEDLMQLKPSPANLARFAKRHRAAVRLSQPYGTMLDLIGLVIR